eukprot:scaffold131_cov125-Cylindrotheca_fusiformis.AAC.3
MTTTRTTNFRNRSSWCLVSFLLIGSSFSCSAFSTSFPLSTVSSRRRKTFLPARESQLLSSLVEGLHRPEDFDRFRKVDETLRNLKEQLPSTLIRPLTTTSANKVYEKDVKLTVLVPNSKQGEITLLQSREELISLSDVLVLATSAARQARSLLVSMPGGGRNPRQTKEESEDPIQTVRCQLALQADTLNSIRIPWKTKVPLLPSAGSTTSDMAQLEGLSEFILNSTSGLVQTHRLRNVTWNGRSINGPEIGRALATIQDNLQRAPRLPPLFDNGGNNVWKDLRDGILEQAAATAASSNTRSKESPLEPPPIYSVDDIQSIHGWIQNNNTSTNSSSSNNATKIPLPGDREWKDYVAAHECLVTFFQQGIPMLEGTDGAKSTTTKDLFAPNATFAALDGTILMTGRESIANFYKSLSLARRGMGQTWTVTQSSVLDWRNRSLAIDYTATNPLWNIKGRDMYSLNQTVNRPIVEKIQQLDFQAKSTDGNLVLDGNFLIKNLVGAVERSPRGTAGGVNMGELLADRLLQQSSGNFFRPTKGTATTTSNGEMSEISESAAANIYYLMSSLLKESKNLFDDKSENALPPGAGFLQDNVELSGYVGETLLMGRKAYIRVFKTILSGSRQSIAQKLLVLEKQVPPRVELTAEGSVRLFLEFHFRLPPPQLLPDTRGSNSNNNLPGVPLKIELASDYTVDALSGLVTKHKFIETRINGQLTSGDVLARWMARFLRMDNVAEGNVFKRNEDFVANFVDSIGWFRKPRSTDS